MTTQHNLLIKLSTTGTEVIDAVSRILTTGATMSPSERVAAEVELLRIRGNLRELIEQVVGALRSMTPADQQAARSELKRIGDCVDQACRQSRSQLDIDHPHVPQTRSTLNGNCVNPCLEKQGGKWPRP